MSAASIFDDIKVFLPAYLTPREKDELFRELSAFPEKMNLYSAEHQDELLQGDGWSGFVAINFETLQRRVVSGVILSNSCDISADNQRDIPASVLFAPLIRLGRIVAAMEEAGKSQEQVRTTVETIRNQRVTRMFYLPPHSDVLEESVILLDDIHRHPLDDFLERPTSKLFTLTQFGFYLFVLKLSIHFCRFQENISRISGPE